MMMAELDPLIQQVESIQKLNPAEFARETDLGTAMGFQDAVAPLRRTVSIYRQIPTEYIAELSSSRQETLNSASNRVTSLTQSIRDFDPTVETASTIRSN